MEPRKDQNQENSNEEIRKSTQPASDHDKQDDWHDQADTDKYLAMEQPGVSFTKESSVTMNSDYYDSDSIERQSDKWKASGGNSRNADAFSQDDYILNDNIDLDEEQNQSISSDDK